MSEKEKETRPEDMPPITIWTCGPGCRNNGEHQWDGPVVKIDRGASSSCSKCGKLAIEVSMWM